MQAIADVIQMNDNRGSKAPYMTVSMNSPRGFPQVMCEDERLHVVVHRFDEIQATEHLSDRWQVGSV
jgi:hypothetical protein